MGRARRRDPWTVLLEDHPDVLLVRTSIAGRGRWYNGRRAIVLRVGLLIVEERATLWHEIVHLRRGDTRCEGLHSVRQEASCHREAARCAIDIHDLADALVWTSNVDELADELKTTAEYVQIRLDPRYLHPAERGLIRRRLAMKEESA